MGIEHVFGPHHAKANPANDQTQRERQQGDSDPIGLANLLLNRRSSHINVISSFILFFTFLAIVGYTELTREANNQNQQTFQATERPYVALGDRNGRVGEFVFLSPNVPVALKMYFFNSGREPATDVTINLFAFGTGITTFTPQHIERWKMVKPSGEIMSFGAGFGNQAITIPGESTFVLYRSGRWIPDPLTFQLIDQGTAKREFEPEGTVEYCDRFGKYHCFPFGARYLGNPIHAFVVGIAPIGLCPNTPMSDTPDPEFVHQPNGEIDRQVAILRCRQPDEQFSGYQP